MSITLVGIVICLIGVMTDAPSALAREEGTMSLILKSAAFQAGRPIPSKYTCEGQDVSPPLAWEGAPADTKSFALINDDPDAPGRTWVHWVLFNVPASVRHLPEELAADRELADGSRQGMTDFGRMGYGGPCPPSGTHRYYFTLYALDTMLALAPGATKPQLEAAMQGHMLAQAQLMGTYRRAGR